MSWNFGLMGVDGIISEPGDGIVLENTGKLMEDAGYFGK
jgi:hypothetical protein